MTLRQTIQTIHLFGVPFEVDMTEDLDTGETKALEVCMPIDLPPGVDPQLEYYLPMPEVLLKNLRVSTTDVNCIDSLWDYFIRHAQAGTPDRVVDIHLSIVGQGVT